jgi:hypothetical protein
VQLDGQGLKPIPVQTGISDDAYAELLDGSLTEGERVIVGLVTTDKSTSQTTLPGFGMRWRR